MLSKEESKRYSRQIILSDIGLEGQQKLKAAKVLVVGAGGLGCPVLQYLTAAGVGTIGIIDHDVVDETNLHRQILYSVADVGKSKAETAATKLLALNPYVAVRPFAVRLTSENATVIFEAFDLIVDGSDNFETRYLVNDACVQLDKPLVFGSIFGFEGQVSVFNYRGGPTYRCVFPEAGEAPNCAVNGVLGVLPGIVGTYMANEALKVILEIGEPLSGKLMVLNVLDNAINFFKVKRVLEVQRTPSAATRPAAQADEGLSYSAIERMLAEKPEEIFLVDVREPLEAEADPVGDVNIPLSEIADSVHEFPPDKTLIFYCNSGRRSKAAMDLAKAAGVVTPMYWGKGEE
ncbi:HesA/MoeB/ThiF family protein [Pedobacter sp. SYSU D00535]|uniref:HesA/MoeB/ThiF family protein n=1 Tax=Pedobacter sp. SYSU D00535 TaxID=2810308 RepID=UPI001A96C997|nr:HesA/MoeB/ThiF family protein [Pedobacter sp. SYSU D00535]